MQYLIDNKEWIFSGIGILVITSIFSASLYLIRLLWLRFYQLPKVINKYKGVYELYYYLPFESKVIKQIGLQIYWSWLGNKIKVELKSDRFSFKGELIKKEHNIIIELLGANYRKMPMSIIFYEPLIEDFQIMLGTFNTVTLNSSPYAGKILLKKVPLTTINMVTIRANQLNEINPVIKEYLAINSKESIVVKNPDNPFLT